MIDNNEPEFFFYFFEKKTKNKQTYSAITKEKDRIKSFETRKCYAKIKFNGKKFSSKYSKEKSKSTSRFIYWGLDPIDRGEIQYFVEQSPNQYIAIIRRFKNQKNYFPKDHGLNQFFFTCEGLEINEQIVKLEEINGHIIYNQELKVCVQVL